AAAQSLCMRRYRPTTRASASRIFRWPGRRWAGRHEPNCVPGSNEPCPTSRSCCGSPGGAPRCSAPADMAKDPAAPALGEIVGRGAVADIHAAGDGVVKLFHAGRPPTAAFIEAATLAIVGTHVLPAPRVHGVSRYGERWGVVMDRVEGPT